MKQAPQRYVGLVFLLLTAQIAVACSNSQEPTWELVDTSITFESTNIRSAQFSPDGALLGITTNRGIHLYRFDTLAEVWYREQPSDALAFSPDGSLIASSAMEDDIITIQYPDTGEIVKTLTSGYEDTYSIHDLSFSPNSELVAATVNRSTTTSMVVVWNVQTGDQLLALQPKEPIGVLESTYGPSMRVVFSPDGALLASGWFGSLIILWDAETGERVRDLQDLENAFGTVDGLDWNLDGSLLASGHRGGTVAIWDPHSGKLLYSFITGDDYAYRVRWSPKGNYLAVGTSSGRIMILDTRAKLLHTLAMKNEFVNTAAWSTKGNYLVAGDTAGNVYIWKVQE